MDRHVIANMGTEPGALTTVFPSDEQIRRHLAAPAREQDWRPLAAEDRASYDIADELMAGGAIPWMRHRLNGGY
ncbi:hypothetical protein ACFV2N_05175 [Streptomyces sp. NPDC059680]|uniref:hypothetical protein n=1 Tax=Streptomyces sp. NPDC059680 TaxID=3346904 RepID=UPI00369960AB